MIGVATSPDVLSVERIARVQAMRADGLRPHHIGKEFAGIGVLESYTVTPCCIEVRASGNDIALRHDLRIGYYKEARRENA
ncbi:hypothetical protein K0817_009360 [Microbacterium sp. HD4P20]|uniref:hypothetical protein n=1 Tax=Microbacterium sp. HD4P20 TaxID=2864874 RepID=UPI001C640834|nr:hypothetical protein [Microbacterium sp. HD4P20]MCP2636771.1 hypothetical protein [Microbacterium sp. HD4P20]